MTQRFSKSVFFQIKFEKTIMHLRPYKSSCIKHDIETYIYTCSGSSNFAITKLFQIYFSRNFKGYLHQKMITSENLVFFLKETLRFLHDVFSFVYFKGS